MNTRPLIFLIATVLHGAATEPSARNLPALMPAPEFALRHAGEIGLTGEQRAKLESETRDLEAAARKFSEQARIESGTLARLLAKDAPDEAAVAVQFEKVLAAEAEVKRLRLKTSLRTRAVLTMEQQGRLASLQSRGTRGRTPAPEQQELAARMERVRQSIERAKSEGRDLAPMREMWRRVDQLTREGKTAEALLVLEETARSIENSLSSPSANK